MKIAIDIKSVLILTVAFILFTAIGTVSHEYGHIIVAESVGYKTTLHYRSMNYDSGELNDKHLEIYNHNRTEIENGTDFKKKSEYESGVEKLKFDGFLVTIGGPFQTTFTGVAGLLILLFRRKKIGEYGLNLLDWLAVFLSLFWLREFFNLVMSVVSEIIFPNGSYFGGDEQNISYYLNLWEGTISIILGIAGLAISLFVIFKIVPNRLRLTFILSGLLGGIIGFILWMNILGPIVLP
ncbi:MAG: hypothetical protein Q8O72_04090 [Bacteroidales bacterium]|nr:hypothetical protein [Bacteroidales bacterium]